MLAVAVLLTSSCKKEKKTVNVLGQWNLTGVELTTKAAQIGDVKVDVYIDFKEGGTYEMYQFLGQGRYELLKGQWNLAENLLSGNYAGSKTREWGNSYHVAIDGDVMTMTATVGSSDVSTYTRCTIPDEVKKSAVTK